MVPPVWPSLRRAGGRGWPIVVVGGGAPWQPTYGMWRDEVPDVPGPCFRHVSGRVIVHGHRRHEIERAFAIVDNDALRAHFARGVDVRVGRVERIEHFGWGSRVVTKTGDDIDARLAVEATGSRPGRTAQVAFGIVVAELPPGIARDTVTLMDLRAPPGGGGGPPSSATSFRWLTGGSSRRPCSRHGHRRRRSSCASDSASGSVRPGRGSSTARGASNGS